MEPKILLSPKKLKPSLGNWEISGVLNPGAIRLPNKKILLMVRVAESSRNHILDKCPMIVAKKEYLKVKKKNEKEILKDSKGNTHYLIYSSCVLPTLSHFRKVVLDKTGMKVEKISEKPDFFGRVMTSEYGVEDPRIIKMGGKYLMTYVSVSERDGVYSSLAISKDLENWERKGIIFQEQNKDAVIFPEKIRGRYVALNRPESNIALSKPDIWISYSKDLIYWGKEKNILLARPNSWEEVRNGAGCPPIKTPKGWLVIYHGVQDNADRHIYSAGAVLLDLKNPEKVLARSPANKPLFSPMKSFETTGFISNVVFPTGIVWDLNKKDLLIYSGGADSVVTVRKISLKEIFGSLEFY